MKKKFFNLIRFSMASAAAFFWMSSLVYAHGFAHGLILAMLSWTFYVLCVPAMHGRFFLGPLFDVLHFYPEPFVWAFAVAVNLCTVFAAPWLYDELIITRLLYHVLAYPFWCWAILIVGALGTFYRTIIGRYRIENEFLRHRFIQQLIMLTGIFLIVFFLLEPLVIILNLTVSA